MDPKLCEKWVEMAIREVWTQCQFAKTAFININNPILATSNDVIFSSIHSFLTHVGNASKMLEAPADPAVQDKSYRWFLNLCSWSALFSLKKITTRTIGDLLSIKKSDLIHKHRNFRNGLEHYDDRLWKWIKNHGLGVSIADFNIMPKNAIRVGAGITLIFVRNLDPNTRVFTLIGDDLDLVKLHNEVVRIQNLADAWVKSNT